jgi:uncharacterized membrane protein
MESNTSKEESKKPKSRKILVLGIVIFLFGLVVIASGISIYIYNQGNDSDGYVYSNVYHVNTSVYAFALYMNQYTISTWGFLGAANVAQLKFIVKATDPSRELFTGYATTKEGEPYLQSFECEIPTNWHWWAEPYYAEIFINTTTIAGTGAPASLPVAQTFWLAQAHSNSIAEMTYLPLKEQHIWFIMNQDGSKNVSADIQIAFKSPILTVLPFILIPLGIVFSAVGIYFFRRKKYVQIP